MKKSIVAIALLSSAAMAASASASLLIADGFNYTAGTNNLAGQTDTDYSPNPATWALTGSSSFYGQSVGAGNVTYPGAGAPAHLPGSNNAQLIVPSGSNSASDRIQLTSPVSNFSQALDPGTSLYYSFTMQVTDISALASTAGGTFVAGFNNLVGTSGTSLSTAGAALCDRRDSATSTTYHLGIAQSQTGRTYDNTTSYNVGDILFIVGQYNFGATDGTDTADLYVFDGTTGAAIPVSQPGVPSIAGPTVGDLPGGDIIESFFLRDQGTSFAANVDDVRVGTTWTDVTAVPEPASLSLLAIGALAGLARRRRMA